MSKFSCSCGYVIRDQTDSNPNKGELLSDCDYSSFFDWLAGETQSYIEAAQSNDVRGWLSNRGYSPAYPAEQLSHGEVLHDHLHSRFNQIVREVYQCPCCNRMHVEGLQSNNFYSYIPKGDGTPVPFSSNLASES
jgi:hypothetical protein